MTDFTIGTSIQNKDVVDDIEDAIADGIKSGSRSIGKTGADVAEARIREVGAVWTGQLANSFKLSTYNTANGMVVVIENDSDHAAPLEYGAEYTDRGPPVEALIPWVMTKMRGFNIPEDEGKPDIDREQLEIETTYGSEDLSASVPQPVLEKAFWLQKRIKEEGIDAVRYMDTAEQWIDESGPATLSAHIDAQLRDV